MGRPVDRNSAEAAKRGTLTGLAFGLLLVVALAGPGPIAVGQGPPTPSAHGYRGADQPPGYAGDFAALATAVDAFWAEVFGSAGVNYGPPAVVTVDRLLHTGCGPSSAGDTPFYCPEDATIYLHVWFMDGAVAEIGDFAAIMVLAHEWGHHVQTLANAPYPSSKPFELQADCLAGVYANEAERQGLLDPGDVTEGVLMSASVGDPAWMPQDSPGAHGTNDERITEFMRGYINGLGDCDLPGFAGDPPIRDGDSPRAITAYLPTALPLDHAACFRIEADDVLIFDDLAGRLGGTEEARRRLQEWGWRASVRRVFACDRPPAGGTGWVSVDVHQFADAAAAREAVDHFAAVLAEGTALRPGAPLGAGDHSASLSGPASNGQEHTVYASRGPFLVRVTGVSPSGLPFIDVREVARAILAPPASAPTPWPSPTSLPPATVPDPTSTPTPTTGIAAYLPDVLPLTHAVCFRGDPPVEYDFATLVERFPGVPGAAGTLQALGWQEGAYRQFRCTDPPADGVNWIDASVHRFRDAASAAAAGPYYASARAIDSQLDEAVAPPIGDSATALAGPSDDGSEYTLYVSSGPLLLRVTGVAPVGDPETDVKAVMLALHAGSLDRDEPGVPSPEPTTLPGPTLVPTPPAADPAGDAVAYDLIDLGTGDGNWSSASHINERGQVLWTWATAQDPMTDRARDPHPMLWANGASSDLTAVGADFAVAINDSGTILAQTHRAGEGPRNLLYDVTSGSVSAPSAFEDGFFVDFNNAGAVVGSLAGNTVVANDGPVRIVPVPTGFEFVEAAAIAESGSVTGRALIDLLGGTTQRAILFADGVVTVLDAAPGSESSSASDLNDVGQVIGNAGFSGMHNVHAYGRAFLYDHTTRATSDLGTLPGYQNSLAAAINNAGQVVGAAWLPEDWQPEDRPTDFRRAFVYDHRTGEMVDLNERIPQGSGWYLVDAFDINDTGQIVGRGLIGGEMHAFLLTPTR